MDNTVNHNECLARFKTFYADFKQAELAELDRIYTADVRFCDPVHRIEGRAALHHYFANARRNLSECRFEYLDQIIEPHRAYIKWDMCFRHPKLNQQQMIRVRGASQILYSELGVYYHEDFYDLGAMLYEHVPVLSSLTRFLKRRMAD